MRKKITKKVTKKKVATKKPTPKEDKKYIARMGFAQKDVDIIAPYLHETLFPDGQFDESVALKDARRPRSPLHNYIDWDDQTAAQAHRLLQIKRLFTCFYIITPEKYKVPSVVSIRVIDEEDTKKSKRSYVATTKAIQETDFREQLVQEAIRGLLSWKKRYEMFADLPQFLEITKIIKVQFEENKQSRWEQEKTKAKARIKDWETNKRVKQEN